MTLKKTSFFTVFFFVMFLSLFNFLYFMGLEIPLIKFPDMTLSLLSIGFYLDKSCFTFMVMVMMVTSMVLMYSQFYMDLYNNKKFFYLTVSFLGSMIVLSFTGSMTTMMIGWDGLGMSSLFLIMFYPGKIPLFNSFMTFFYNRLGDCVMILSFCSLLIFSLDSFFCLHFSSNMEMFLIFIFLCSFTKSAQVPVSSWLPAAMSAPTPISAMVHSSTLVTAGLFLFIKFSSYFYFLGLLKFLTFISATTFILGGLLGVLETDLKKIVAFSTMSQISMVIFFVSVGMMASGMSHMFFHALFKTLLFCSCGISFLWVMSDQLMKNFSHSEDNIMFFFLMLVSVYSMSGLLFSSSFYSKDLVLESFFSYNEMFMFILLILGSMLTLFYSCKISSLCFSSFNSLSFSSMKKSNFFFFSFIFSMATLFSPYFCQWFIFNMKFPVVSMMELLLILSILSLGLVVNLNLKSKFSFLSLDLGFSKFFMFGMIGTVMKLDKNSFHFSDQLVFKPNLFFKNLESLFNSNYLTLMLLIVLMVLIF